MPLKIDNNLPTNFPSPDYLTLGNFKKGVITLIDKSRLPKDALEQADNIFLVEDGQPSLRPGVDWFGTAPNRVLSTTITNLVVNPSFETDTTSWTTAGVGASIARNTSEYYTGIASLKLTTASSGNQQATITVTGLSIAQTYKLQARVKASAAGKDIYLQSSIDGYSAFFGSTSTGGWDFLSGTITATATSGTIELGVFSNSDFIYIDAVMMETGTTATDYFDGSTADSELIDYSWTGTAHNSTSTKATYTSAEIDGVEYFDYAGAIHLVCVAGTTVYRSTDDGDNWTACTGATLTSGLVVNMNQNGGYLYLTNGTDNIVRYDGTTTLQTYTALTTPSAPTVTETGSGLTAGTSYQYYYKSSRVNSVGFSAASSASVVIQTGLARESWSAGTNYATLALGALSGTQTRYDIYVSEDDIDYFYLGSTSTATFVDDGTALTVPSTLAPTDNTTQGPLVEELTNVGSRQYGVRDSDNRYRIWFTGSGAYAGAFSTAYDGGYLDWQEGGKYIPVKVVDYRTGKNDPIATIFCKSADGQGSIIQMSLETFTVGDISVIIPSAYTLPGSRGTPSPGSVVNVLNDYMFYNSQAFYNLGSRAQFLNLLSTDEVSANIRPTIKTITTDAEDLIASVYYDAKVYFSVPYGSTTNNYTAVYDTERKAWLPTAFTLGFKKFLRYTDTSGTAHLLALKPGDTKLSEISTSIQGDYNTAFTSTLMTGLYSTSKNRFEFQWTEEAEMEFSNPTGEISIELIGLERGRGFTSQGTATVTSQLSTTGWDTFLWDTTLWDDTSTAIDTYSESSVKRYFRLGRELNAVQWRITTNSLDANYVLRTLQTWGTQTNAGKPRTWRLDRV